MEKIVQIGIDRLNHTKREFIGFTDNKKTNTLLNDIEKNPHVYLLACLMDRQIKAEKAWAIPQKIFDILGTHNFNELEKIEKEKFTEIFEKNKLHRFNSEMANVFYQGIHDIKKNIKETLLKYGWQAK